MYFRFETGVRWTDGRCLECGFLYICLNVRQSPSFIRKWEGLPYRPRHSLPSSPDGRRIANWTMRGNVVRPFVNQRGLISGIRNHISMISEVDVLKIFLPFCKIFKCLQIICATTSEIQLKSEPRILTRSTLRITNTEHEHRQKQESN